ncbi:hypothetical protein FACS1894147_03890 [Spirochaetia bacterium]|nr:hypothetical protein FACS1894147_03890 [Spirochaetia bacterium]
MRRCCYIVVFYLFVYSMTVNALSKPLGEIAVLNQKSGSIYITVEVFKELEIEVDGRIVYSLEFLSYREGGIIIGTIDDFELKPFEKTACFFYSRYSTKQIEFSKLGPIEQIKMVYSKFAITDENGIELLNLDTLRPEHFKEKQEGAQWYLVVK